MYNIKTLCIVLWLVEGGIYAMPVILPSYNLFGQFKELNRASHMFGIENEQSETTTKQIPIYSTIDSTSAPPQFEYVEVGQDSNDQQWYRVLVANQTGYKTEIESRNSPQSDEADFDPKLDKSITDLLDWMDDTDQQRLNKVYNELVNSKVQVDNIDFNNDAKIKRNVGSLEFIAHTDHPNENSSEMENHIILTTQVTPVKRNPRIVENFLRFIRGLK